MKKRIRFGILGSGYMGNTHAEAVRRLPNAELVAIAGGRRAPGLAERCGVACDSSPEVLLKRPDIDAVVITTPHHLHGEEAVRAFEEGKHALVEKPLATSVEDCDRMIEAASRAGRVLAVGYHQRFRINNAKARSLIAENAIGQVQVIQVSMPMYAGAIKTGGFGGNWDWWNRPESRGHLFNSAPHAIDLMRWFTGREVASVSALCRTLIPGIQVEDTTLALIELSNGAICSFFSSRALPAPSFPGEDFRIRITGSSGLIDLDPFGELRVSDENGWRTVSRQPVVGHEGANTAYGDVRLQAYRDQIASFIAAIDGRPGAIGTAADGRAGVVACSAMLQSSAARCWVQIVANHAS